MNILIKSLMEKKIIFNDFNTTIKNDSKFNLHKMIYNYIIT